MLHNGLLLNNPVPLMKSESPGSRTEPPVRPLRSEAPEAASWAHPGQSANTYCEDSEDPRPAGLPGCRYSFSSDKHGVFGFAI